MDYFPKFEVTHRAQYYSQLQWHHQGDSYIYAPSRPYTSAPFTLMFTYPTLLLALYMHSLLL